MINLDQSIAKIKWEIENTTGVDREELIELIMHEGAGKDRKTLLKWLNGQVDAYVSMLSDADIRKSADDLRNQIDEDVFNDLAKPVYRPEKRGGVWCIFDTANSKVRQETFDVKGDARAYITQLELDVNGLIEEKPYHYKRSE